MLKVDIICVSRAKKGAHSDLINDYKKRIRWNLNIIEIESKHTSPAKAQKEESEKLLQYISPSAYIIALDERGKTYKSLDFAQKIEFQTNAGINHIQFLIGGADGHTQEIRNKSSLLLSFGSQTWPHLLARIMLLEQIYRTQQILAGHPYHRE